MKCHDKCFTKYRKLKPNTKKIPSQNTSLYHITTVIRQKGESQKGCFKKKQSMPNFPKSEHFLPPDTHKICVSEGKKRSFSGKFGVFCFFETPVLRFALLHYCLVVGFGNNRTFFHVFYSMSSL